MNEVAHWLVSLEEWVPLQGVDEAVASPILRKIVSQPSIRGTLSEALLWLRVGIFQPAHILVQDGRNDVERYIHGIVHRLEGDFWNSKYWFRQVRNREFLKALEEAIPIELREFGLYDSAQQIGLFPNGCFSSSQFVDQCERLIASSKKDRNQSFSKTLVAVGQAEWNAVWNCIEKHGQDVGQ
jgi:hypothetical protein